MKFRCLVILICIHTLVGCATSGGGTRTSKTIYQPTKAENVEILFEQPTKPYEVIGMVRCYAGAMASDDACYRALQKEAAELGAMAVLTTPEIAPMFNGVTTDKRVSGKAIRWKDGASSTSYALTPTSTIATTPQAEQVIPKSDEFKNDEVLPFGTIGEGKDESRVYFYSPYDPKTLLSLPLADAGKPTTCPKTGKRFVVPKK